MGTIGCDYSTEAIWLARLTSQKANLKEMIRVPVDDDLRITLRDINRALFGMSMSRQTSVIYIEKPWGRYNIGTAMVLTRIATLVEVEATRVGLSVREAPLGSWRKNIFGKGSGKPKRWYKEQAVSLAKELWGSRRELTHDEAEAALIALYGWRLENASV